MHKAKDRGARVHAGGCFSRHGLGRRTGDPAGRPYISLVALAAAFAAAVSADTLSLHAVLTEALANNPGYLAARADRGYAEDAHSSAGLAGYLPTAAATAG
jgi:hypothetical protein